MDHAQDDELPPKIFVLVLFDPDLSTVRGPVNPKCLGSETDQALPAPICVPDTHVNHGLEGLEAGYGTEREGDQLFAEISAVLLSLGLGPGSGSGVREGEEARVRSVVILRGCHEIEWEDASDVADFHVTGTICQGAASSDGCAVADPDHDSHYRDNAREYFIARGGQSGMKATSGPDL